VELGLFAHRRYLDAHGYPQTINALGDHALIGFDTETPLVRRLRPDGLPYAREHFALRTDSDLAALAAIRAGIGIGIMQAGLARRDAQLMRLFPAEVSLFLESWVVMHEDLRPSLRVRRLFDHLAAALEAYARG
jgi:DNA-binding transcriptional LysR family regulator